MLANRAARATAPLPAKHPPSYSTIARIAAAPRVDGAWTSFVRDVMGMPDWMLPAVQYAVRQKAWAQALDPIQTLRKGAELKAARMELGPKRWGINEDDNPGEASPFAIGWLAQVSSEEGVL